MKAAFRSRLKGNTDAGAHVDWGWRKQGDPLPAITLTTMSDPRPCHMGGPQNTRQTIVQLDTWADTAKEARDVADQAIALAVPPTVTGGVRFLTTFVDDDSDGSEDTPDGLLARVRIKLRVTHTIP
jgi:hypothetical protein